MLYNYFCLFSLAANHKKRLLHRWLEIHHEEGGRQDECEMETEVPKETVAQDEEPERPSSSLFEDFSDDDFDEREENGTSKEGVKMDTDSAVEREKLEEKEIDTVTVTPPTSPPIVATKPVSSQIQPSPVADNSPPTPPLQFSPAIESYTQETAPEKTDVKNDETEMDVDVYLNFDTQVETFFFCLPAETNCPTSPVATCQKRHRQKQTIKESPRD